MRKNTVSSTMSAPYSNRPRTMARQNEIDLDKTYHAMEKGHRVCKISLNKKWDPAYKRVALLRETRQLEISRLEANPHDRGIRNKPSLLDLRLVKEVHILDFKLNSIRIGDKWTRDKELRAFDTTKILVIQYGNGFNLNLWILLFDNPEACRLWSVGVHALMMDTLSANHPVVMERWLRKHFNNLLTPGSDNVARKHIKPFVQTSLQYKVGSKQLQEITEEQNTFEIFIVAAKQLVFDPTIFSSYFASLSEDNGSVLFSNFLMFLKEYQNDDMGNNKERTAAFLRDYLYDSDHLQSRTLSQPNLTLMQFSEFLFSRENTLWDSMNEKVVHDMTRPLSHYWIASSHNTYLTGDQLRSESSLDSYARALLMGCRCIELDCWDGQKKSNSNDFLDIVIYHGYTMTSKLLLRDVLYTIRHYAFINSEYPVILSIEDNCSVPAQRLLAQEVREILGDQLLTQPVSREETQLPSPAALKRRIILKHKKLPVESEDITPMPNDEFQDTDILSKDCVKRGVLYLKSETTHEWTAHAFVLFTDRLCYVFEECSEESGLQPNRDDSVSLMGDDDREEDSLLGLGVRPEEMHVTEEWFHGKADRMVARERLLKETETGNGVFLVRESTTFLGDYSLSFLHNGAVHHIRIKTHMIDGEKKYYFLEEKVMDTLYELISFYTKNPLQTPKFEVHLTTPCPQPQPHLNMPWFSATADKDKAEELLNSVREDGAFLIRYSSADKNVFVLSIRVDGEFWHYRLKRDGRIFVVNQMVFENLNQIVDYFSNKDFVRGIGLKYPVNEHDVGQYAHMEHAVATPGCYMDLKDLDKEVQARALRPYKAIDEEELSFPVNAIITVLRKEEHLWRGRYGSQTGWFPPAYVQEILTAGSNNNAGEPSAYGTIELAGTTVERVNSSDCERQFALRIAFSYNNGPQWLIAARTKEEMEDWHNQLLDLTRSVTEKVIHLRNREKDLRIASELSNLVVYCQAVPFDANHVANGNFYEMCSFVETKLDKLLEKGLVQFNCRQLSRVYPQGSRITSANFNPVPMWNAACNMVALNYQTGDRPMQLNQGKFLGNGKCGYVLKPAYMIDPAFDPTTGEKVTTSQPVRVTVQVIGGRHLSRKDKNKGICSPFVEVELIGLDCDNSVYKTHTVASNGLNPNWGDVVNFDVHCPEVALIRFLVEDGDFVGPKTDPFIGQAVFPLDSIRTGYRSVPLRNQFSEELELSSLLVFIKISPLADLTTTIKSPHAVLQANRSVFAGVRSLSQQTSNASSSPQLISHGRGSSSDILAKTPTSPLPDAVKKSPSLQNTRSDSTESTDSNARKTSKSNRFRKFFGSFGKKEKE